MSGQVVESCTACLRVFSAFIRMSAAFLRSASESMAGSFGAGRGGDIAGCGAADESMPRSSGIGACSRFFGFAHVLIGEPASTSPEHARVVAQRGKMTQIEIGRAHV